MSSASEDELCKRNASQVRSQNLSKSTIALVATLDVSSRPTLHAQQQLYGQKRQIKLSRFQSDQRSNPPRILLPLLFFPDRFFPLLHLHLKLAPLSIVFNSPPLSLSLPEVTPSVPTPMMPSMSNLLDRVRRGRLPNYINLGNARIYRDEMLIFRDLRPYALDLGFELPISEVTYTSNNQQG